MFAILSNGYSSIWRIFRSPHQCSAGFLFLVILCLCSILFSTSSVPKFLSKTRLESTLQVTSNAKSHDREPFQWKDRPKRLIVFGDSSCDNGQYLDDEPPGYQDSPQRIAQSQVWTNRLCEKISCVHHDNFARPPKSAPSSSYSPLSTSALEIREAVIDSSLLNSNWMAQQRANHSSMISELDIKDPVADLKTQVQQWMSFENRQFGTSRSTIAEKESTVFSLCFSTWEIWYYSAAVHSNAQVAVTKSLDTLFEQLDLIAENWASSPKILLLNAVDPTFLPRWRKVRTGPYGADPFSEDQRNAVLLVEQWNLALAKRAKRWTKGSIVIYDINKWLLDQIRQSQFQNKKWRDASSLVTSQTTWQNVEEGCFGSVDHPLDEINDSGKGKTCSVSDSYLFRDDYHLGSAAMRMVGDDIAAIVLGQSLPR